MESRITSDIDIQWRKSIRDNSSVREYFSFSFHGKKSHETKYPNAPPSCTSGIDAQSRLRRPSQQIDGQKTSESQMVAVFAKKRTVFVAKMCISSNGSFCAPARRNHNEQGTDQSR
jgi:hypothetical protein